MTKSTGVGRGGHRPGAGRKSKAKPPSERREVPKTSATVADVEALAKSHTALAVQVLAEIALNGEKEAARVAAANALLDRGHGKPAGVGAGTGDGKKAQRQANAEKSASGGRFAAPNAPKLVVNNRH